MAKVNYQTNEIEFDLTELDAAWENAPVIVNKDPNLFRLCYICKFHMEHAKFVVVLNDGFAWKLDLINAKKPTLENDNYIAVHQSCIANRNSLDSRKQLKYIRATKWEFDIDFWNEQNK